jgi:hypothetical protein
MSGTYILTMPQTQTPTQEPPTQTTLSIPKFIRDLFKSREVTEFDLCYYETRKVALCAHLLKNK